MHRSILFVFLTVIGAPLITAVLLLIFYGTVFGIWVGVSALWAALFVA